MAEQNTYCPVCGYDLKLSRVDEIVDRCPSCGFRFEDVPRYIKAPFNHFDEKNLSVRIWRTMWAEAHLPWSSKDATQPDNWDPIKQMYNIGLQLASSIEEWKENHPVITSENNEKFLQLALKQIERLDWKPEVIEALWDGDT